MTEQIVEELQLANKHEKKIHNFANNQRRNN